MGKILVTGANGQLGNEIRNLSGSITDLLFLFTDVDQLDLTNKRKTTSFIEKHQPDYIVNCAAYTAVDNAESDKNGAYLINRDIPVLLSELSEKIGAKFIHISTDYVFPGNKPIPLAEGDETGPKSVYGASKLAGEQGIMNSKNTMIIRTSWLYSLNGSNFVKTMFRLLTEREKIKVVFDQTGSPTYASDLASAIVEIIRGVESEEGQPFLPGIFHYSNEGVASWYDVAVQISSIANLTCHIEPVRTEEFPLPAPRPVYSVMNKKKIRESYQIFIPYWRDSLIKCVNHMKVRTNLKK